MSRFFLILAATLTSLAAWSDAEPASMQAFMPIVNSKDLAGAQKRKYCSYVDSDSGACLMTLVNAKNYCARVGAHLPDIREFAKLSHSLGAKGILSGSETNTEYEGPDHDKLTGIFTQNTDNSIDKFYYSSAGYRRPTDSLGNNLLWSSSRYYAHSDYDVYVFIEGDGDIFRHDSTSYGAVRCVAGR
jgi:hypothetical protein